MAQRPKRLKGYLLVDRKPSEGGFADVWEAVDQQNKRLVAIKILSQTKSLSAFDVRRFFLEARIGRQFDHPNIAKVYEIDQDNGEYFIVMEYIDGETVKQLMRQNRLSREECLRIVKDSLGALDYVHNFRTQEVESIVHRDVKPNNIMIERKTGRTVLLDFGIAAVRGDINKTMKSQYAVGTPEYMSPEQFNYVDGKPAPVDLRSDLYSMGVVLYEMMTGQLPFLGHDSAQLGFGHVYAPVPVGPLKNPEPPHEPVDPSLRAVILTALRKDPVDRFKSAAEMLAAIGKRSRRIDLQLPFSRRALALAGFGAAALAVLGLLDSRFMEPASPPATGTLAVWAEPQGVVLLDGRPILGETPLVRPVDAGSHRLELVQRMDSFRSPPPREFVMPPKGLVKVSIVDDAVTVTEEPQLPAGK